MLLPQSGRKFGDAAGGLIGDALQNVDEIAIGIDAVQAAGDDQALDDADVFGAKLGPAEEPGLAFREAFP